MDPHAVLGLPPGAPRRRTSPPRTGGSRSAGIPDRGGAEASADGADQRRLRPAARRRVDAAQRARRAAAAPRRAPRPPRRLAPARDPPRARPRAARACSSRARTSGSSRRRRRGRARRRCSRRATGGCSGCSTTPSTAASRRCRFGAIEAAEHSLRRPRRRVATLRVRARNGRRFVVRRPAAGDRGGDLAAQDRRGRPATPPDQRDRHDGQQRERRHRPPARVVTRPRPAPGRGSRSGSPRRATAPSWRVVALIPLPIPSCAGREVAHADGDDRREAEPDADAHQQRRRQPLAPRTRAPARPASRARRPRPR